MAKVNGPLFGFSASGKLGKAIVYSSWKGINVVREWLKPANPTSADQGDRRVMLGGLGRAPKYVQADKEYQILAKAVAPSGQSWISYFVKYIMTTYFTDVAGFDAIVAAYGDSGIAGDFNDDALGLGLTAFNLTYKGMDNVFSPGMQLYCLALYATDQYKLDNTKFNALPYSKDLDTWIDTDIDLMITDFTVKK